jgi:hypothetical protein
MTDQPLQAVIMTTVVVVVVAVVFVAAPQHQNILQTTK